LSGSRVGYLVLRILKGVDPAWRDDRAFLSLYKSAKPETLLDEGRAYVVYQLAQRQRAVEDDYLEIGAYRCGNSVFLSANDAIGQKTIYFVDTWKTSSGRRATWAVSPWTEFRASSRTI
jgi:hypothetical protein